MAGFVSGSGFALAPALWNCQVLLGAAAGAVKVVRFCWEEQRVLLLSSDVTAGFDYLGKWPWEESGGDRMEVVCRWDSAISFSWRDCCTRDSWSFFRKMAKKAPAKWYQWNSVVLRGWIFFSFLALLRSLPLLHWKWSELSQHLTLHL